MKRSFVVRRTAVALLAVLVALVGVSPRAAAGPASPGVRYSVQLEQSDFPDSEVIKSINYDFDLDGIMDTTSPAGLLYYDALTITLSSRPSEPVVIPAGPAQQFGGPPAVITFPGDDGYPSLVFPVFTYNTSWPTGLTPAAPILAHNDHGTFNILRLATKVTGRDVACTQRFPKRANPVCFFASYFNYGNSTGDSRLLEILRDGTFANITKAAGLPFPIPWTGSYDGIFMIGAGFLDFSGDRLPDLLAVGQHGRILTAFSQTTGTMKCSWLGTKGEYMRVFVPMESDISAPWTPACAYIAMENDGANPPPDYLRCYDRVDQQWYDLTLPLVTWSMSRPVRFWTRDGKIVFAAHDEETGQTRLFSLAGKVAIPGTSFQLRVGENAAVEGGTVAVGFTGVSGDSRCPLGVQCFWEGDAIVSLAAIGADEGERTMQVHTSGRFPRSADYGAYTVTLESLTPTPVVGTPIAASDYVATLKVTIR
jgi:hypothetical protein